MSPERGEPEVAGEQGGDCLHPPASRPAGLQVRAGGTWPGPCSLSPGARCGLGLGREERSRVQRDGHGSDGTEAPMRPVAEARLCLLLHWTLLG